MSFSLVVRNRAASGSAVAGRVGAVAGIPLVAHILPAAAHIPLVVARIPLVVARIPLAVARKQAVAVPSVVEDSRSVDDRVEVWIAFSLVCE